MKTYCIADCGCAGGQFAAECEFVPDCSICMGDNQGDRGDKGDNFVPPVHVTDGGLWGGPTMDEWVKRIDEGALKIEEESKQ